jgi:hypothetical protein
MTDSCNVTFPRNSTVYHQKYVACHRSFPRLLEDLLVQTPKMQLHIYQYMLSLMWNQVETVPGPPGGFDPPSSPEGAALLGSFAAMIIGLMLY